MFCMNSSSGVVNSETSTSMLSILKESLAPTSSGTVGGVDMRGNFIFLRGEEAHDCALLLLAMPEEAPGTGVK